MNLNEARKIVGQATLGPAAHYADWISVSENARLFYVTNACQAAERAGLGKVKPQAVLSAMREFYRTTENQTVKVSLAFGSALAQLTVRS